MNEETKWKLQAHLDRELTPAEARQVVEVLARDPQARSLYQELQMTKSLMAGNEPEWNLPETREFFWSKIARTLEAASSRPGPVLQPIWLRWVSMAGALALIALSLTIGQITIPQTRSTSDLSDQIIETPLRETSSFTFRSESALMTVVWVQHQ